MVEDQSKLGKYPLNTTLHTRFISNSDAFMSSIYGNSLSGMAL